MSSNWRKNALASLPPSHKLPSTPNCWSSWSSRALLRLRSPWCRSRADPKTRPLCVEWWVVSCRRVSVRQFSLIPAVPSIQLADAVKEYKTIMTAAGHNVNPQVTISETALPSKSCSGGVILTACENRIVLNQTLDEYVPCLLYLFIYIWLLILPLPLKSIHRRRLEIAYHDVMPSVRRGLFTESA